MKFHDPMVFLVILFIFLSGHHGICNGVNLNAGNDVNRQGCLKSVNECEPIEAHDATCLGGLLPYKQTSRTLAQDSISQTDVFNKLQKWSNLRNVPKCWEVVQPFLCAVYLPMCMRDSSTNLSMIQMPSKEMCDITREPCKIVDLHKIWPEFLQCDQFIYSKGCSVSIVQSYVNRKTIVL